MKKYFSLILAAVFLVTSAVSLIPSAAEQEIIFDSNIIENGGFEDGNSGWIIKNGGDTPIFTNNTDYPAYEGNSCIRLAGYRSNQADAYIAQSITVKKNTDYNISFYAKGTAPSTCRIADAEGFYYGSNDAAAEADINVLSDTVFSKLSEWTLVTATFNSGDCESLFIEFETHSATDPWNSALFVPASERMCIDSICVVECVAENIVINGGFEDGNNGWIVKNSGDTPIFTNNTDYPAYEGSSCIRLAGYRSNQADAYIAQPITVEKYTDYTLSFYAKGTAPSTCRIADAAGFYYGGNDTAAEADINVVSDTVFSKLSEWTLVTATFNSGDCESLFIEFETHSATDPWNSALFVPASERMCIDSISVVECEYENIVTNGNFEDGINGWEYTDDAFSISDDSFEGTACLKLSKDYYKRIGQRLTLDGEHSVYKLNFRYKGAVNNAVNIFSLSTEKHSFDNASVIFKESLTSNSEWTEYIVLFSSGTTVENPVSELYLNFQTSSEGDWFIDDISLDYSMGMPQGIEIGEEPYFVALAKGHTYYANYNGPYITSEDKNLITDSGFEKGTESDGGWNTSSFIGDGIFVTDEQEAVHTGSYGLKFTAGIEEVKGVFTLEVEPQTEYSFTTFVKMPHWSDTNVGDMTFGVINADTGAFVPYLNDSDAVVPFSDTFQLGPSSPDDKWHIMCMRFNSGDASTVGIMLSGNTSTVYFDDMYVFKYSDRVFYTDENSVNRTNWKNAELIDSTILTDCDLPLNIIENADFEEINESFWSSGSVYGANVEIKNTKTVEHKNTLVYENNDLHPDRTYYIKWIDVEPETTYTFSTEYMVEKAGGDTFFGILSGSRSNLRYPSKIVTFGLGESDFSNGNWQKVGVNFYTNDCDRIGFAVFNDGGRTYFDSIRLFETYDEYGNQNGKTEKTEYSMVVNGGFEYGDYGWQTFAGDVVTDGTAHGGESYARLRGYTWFRINQRISVKADMYYRLSFYTKNTTTSTCVVTDTNEWLGVYGQNVLCYKHFSGNEDGSWSRIDLEFYSDENDEVYIWFDSTSSPTPSSGKDELDESIRSCIDDVRMNTLGDVNLDEELDILDLVRIKKYLVGIDTVVSEEDSDLNFDDLIDAVDITKLKLKLLANK